VERFSSIFCQLLKLFPRTEFQALVKEHRAEHHARGFTCWGQFVAMLFCQLGRAHSLREICGGLAVLPQPEGDSSAPVIRHRARGGCHEQADAPAAHAGAEGGPGSAVPARTWCGSSSRFGVVI
jgi:hypothetical protein